MKTRRQAPCNKDVRVPGVDRKQVEYNAPKPHMKQSK